jgi:hypothetical protein
MGYEGNQRRAVGMAESKSEAYQRWLNIPGNREKKNAQKRAWTAENKARIKEYKVGYRTQEVRDREYAAHVEWKKNNPDRLKVYNKNLVQKVRNSPQLLACKKVRGIIYDGLRRQFKSYARLEGLVGLNRNEFKEHLQSQFKEGMSWDNYGSVWQVDHIKPLVLFDLTDDQQYKDANHFTNLQPLFSIENCKKGSKYKEPIRKSA